MMRTLFLLDLESFHKKFVDVLRLFIAQIRAQILHQLDDAMLPKVLISLAFKCVIGHVSYINMKNNLRGESFCLDK